MKFNKATKQKVGNNSSGKEGKDFRVWGPTEEIIGH